jgi:hypothetical protein
MPIQQLKNNSLGGSLGRVAGQGLGGGLSSLLEGLAEGKLQKMQSQHKINELREAFPDIPEGALSFLANKSEKEQLEYLQSIGEYARNNPEPEFGLNSVTPEQKEQLRAYLSSPQAMQERTQEEIDKLNRFINPVQPGDQKMSGLNSILSAGDGNSPEPRGQYSSTGGVMPKQGRGLEGQPAPMENMSLAQSKPRGLSLGSLGKTKRESQLARERLELQRAAEERRAQGTPFQREKFEHQKDKESRLSGRAEEKFNEDISEKTRKYLDPYNTQARASENNIRDYRLLSDLARKGELRTGNRAQLMSKLGLGDFNRNTDTEIASKLVARLGQNASSAFGPGTRLTNFLEQTYQRSLPTLFNTAEGIIAISKLAEKIEEASVLVPHRIREEIIEENDGRVPWNIDKLVKQRAEPEVDKLEKEAFDIASKSAGSNSKRFADLPPASEHKGKKIRDTKTGKIVESDGQEWVEVKK